VVFKKLFEVYIIIILILVVLPLNGLNSILNNTYLIEIRLDYLLHSLGYFLFCMYYLAGQRRGLSLFRNFALLIFTGLMLLLATGTEAVQLSISNQTFNPADLLANATGLVLGLRVIALMRVNGEYVGGSKNHHPQHSTSLP